MLVVNYLCILMLLLTLIDVVVFMINSTTRLVLGYAIKFTIMNVQIIPFNVLLSSFYLLQV